METQVDVHSDTYFHYFFSNKKNFLLFPLTILFFLVGEIIISVYFRLLAEFEQVKRGTSPHFGGDFK